MADKIKVIIVGGSKVSEEVGRNVLENILDDAEITALGKVVRVDTWNTNFVVDHLLEEDNDNLATLKKLMNSTATVTKVVVVNMGVRRGMYNGLKSKCDNEGVTFLNRVKWYGEPGEDVDINFGLPFNA